MSESGVVCGCPGSMSDIAGNAPSLLIEGTSSSHPSFNEESLRMAGTHMESGGMDKLFSSAAQRPRDCRTLGRGRA